jgi:hypothetical protein
MAAALAEMTPRRADGPKAEKGQDFAARPIVAIREAFALGGGSDQ